MLDMYSDVLYYVCNRTGMDPGGTQGRATMAMTLTGTDKQVAWATDIRDELIATMEREMAKPQRLIDRGVARPTQHNMVAQYREVIDILGGITSASWFIDNRNGGSWYDTSPRAMMELLMSELGLLSTLV